MCNQKRVSLLGATILLSLTAFNAQAADSEYSFKVHNNTDSAIKQLLVSETGAEYGFFDIGAGIAAGQTETLVWDNSTNDESCEQWFKAVFADGEESEPVKFTFCEDNLELEFYNRFLI